MVFSGRIKTSNLQFMHWIRAGRINQWKSAQHNGHGIGDSNITGKRCLSDERREWTHWNRPVKTNNEANLNGNGNGNGAQFICRQIFEQWNQFACVTHSPRWVIEQASNQTSLERASERARARLSARTILTNNTPLNTRAWMRCNNSLLSVCRTTFGHTYLAYFACTWRNWIRNEIDHRRCSHDLFDALAF